jgi:asparagine synthase (glutamine-hydrolysing)
MVLKGGDMERVLPRLAWHLEEPRVGQSYPNYYAAKLASRFVKVCLSGAGGDELFGGYPWRYYRTVGSTDFEHYVDNYYSFWQRLLPNDAAKRVFAPVWADVSHVNTRDIFRDVFRDHPRRVERPEDCVNLSLYFEAKTFLHGLLVVEDKLSMAHGLETRVPFLDNDLVDFAMRLPVRFKLRSLTEAVPLDENEPGNKSANYYRRTRDGKLLLREAMRRYIPTEVADAEKQGFSAPDASWFRGDSIDYVREMLYDGAPRIYDLLDRTSLHEMLDDHLEGRHNNRLLVWSLLNLEWWMKQYLV